MDLDGLVSLGHPEQHTGGMLGAKWHTGPVWCCNSLSLGQVELEGLTGHIEFNSKGQRSNYALKILQFTRNGFRQVSPGLPPRWHILPHCSFPCPQPSPFSPVIRMAPALTCPQELQAASWAQMLACTGLPASRHRIRWRESGTAVLAE